MERRRGADIITFKANDTPHYRGRIWVLLFPAWSLCFTNSASKAREAAEPKHEPITKG